MKVREAMHKHAVWIPPEASLSEIARTMRDEDIGALPVGENDRLIGMVTDRDVVVRGFDGKSDPLQVTARDVMSEPIIYCSDNSDLEDALSVMEQRRIRRLPVIDKNHRMVGILSMGDVAAAASPAMCNEAMRAVSAHHA